MVIMEEQLMTLEFLQLYRETMIFAGKHAVPWKTRMEYIASHWDVDKDAFRNQFQRICEEARLPWKTFDLEDAFDKAKDEWREDIMKDIIKNLLQRAPRCYK